MWHAKCGMAGLPWICKRQYCRTLRGALSRSRRKMSPKSYRCSPSQWCGMRTLLRTLLQSAISNLFTSKLVHQYSSQIIAILTTFTGRDESITMLREVRVKVSVGSHFVFIGVRQRSRGARVQVSVGSNFVGYNISSLLPVFEQVGSRGGRIWRWVGSRKVQRCSVVLAGTFNYTPKQVSTNQGLALLSRYELILMSLILCRWTE
jgi:hypothetical protein